MGKRRVRSKLKEFAETTSLHGIGHIPKANSRKWKIFWVIVFTTSLAIFFSQAYFMVTKYMKFETTVQLEIKFASSLFPAATVCNLNPYKNSMLMEVGSLKATMDVFEKQVGQQEKGRSKRSKNLPEHSETLRYFMVSARCILDGTNGKLDPIGNYDLLDMLETTDCLCIHDAQLHQLSSCANQSRIDYGYCQQCHANGLCHHSEFTTNHTGNDSDVCHCNTHNHACIKGAVINGTSNPFLKSLRANITTSNAAKQRPQTAEQLSAMEELEMEKDFDDINQMIREMEIVDTDSEVSTEETLLNAVQLTMDREKKSLTNNFFPAHAVCECSPKGDSCTILRNLAPGQGGFDKRLCLCFYDKSQDVTWPCYEEKMWRENVCTNCVSSGSCDYIGGSAATVNPFANAEGSGFEEGSISGEDCYCQSISRLCVSKAYGILNIWEIEKAKSQHFVAADGSDAPLDETDRMDEILEDYLDRQRAATPTPELVEALGYENITDEVTMATKAKENLVYSISALDEQTKIQLSYSRSEFIIKCSFNGQQCDMEKDFKRHVDPIFGNCYTFNHRNDSTLVSSRAGPMYGLRLVAYVNVSDYLPMTESAGVRIAIHKQSEMPFPDAFGYSAPAGILSSFGLSHKIVERLPHPYGTCRMNTAIPDTYIFTNYEYSTEGCYRSCFQRAIVKKCGCGDPRFPSPKGFKSCMVYNKKGRECVEEMASNNTGFSGDDSECDCNQSCQQDVYEVTYSASWWPTNMKQVGGCTKNDTVECIEEYRRNAAMIELYYEQLNYEHLRESEAYVFTSLLADFGGQLGLFLGMSVITLVEFLVLLFKLCTEGCWSNSQPSTPVEEEPKGKKYLNGSPKRPEFGFAKEDSKPPGVFNPTSIQWIDNL